MATISSHSPRPNAFPSSPFVFSDPNQCVPDSPLHLSHHRSRLRPLRESPVCVVPQISSPLLKKILASSKPSSHKVTVSSPLLKSSKKHASLCCSQQDVVSVPSSAKHTQQAPATPKSQEQVVPFVGYSPNPSSESIPHHNGCTPSYNCNSKEKPAVKTLELFTNDGDIFATREE